MNCPPALVQVEFSDLKHKINNKWPYIFNLRAIGYSHASLPREIHYRDNTNSTCTQRKLNQCKNNKVNLQYQWSEQPTYICGSTRWDYMGYTSPDTDRLPRGTYSDYVMMVHQSQCFLRIPYLVLKLQFSSLLWSLKWDPLKPASFVSHISVFLPCVAIFWVANIKSVVKYFRLFFINYKLK